MSHYLCLHIKYPLLKEVEPVKSLLQRKQHIPFLHLKDDGKYKWLLKSIIHSLQNQYKS
jgi:hypothetical protein